MPPREGSGRPSRPSRRRPTPSPSCGGGWGGRPSRSWRSSRQAGASTPPIRPCRRARSCSRAARALAGSPPPCPGAGAHLAAPGSARGRPDRRGPPGARAHADPLRGRAARDRPALCGRARRRALPHHLPAARGASRGRAAARAGRGNRSARPAPVGAELLASAATATTSSLRYQILPPGAETKT